MTLQRFFRFISFALLGMILLLLPLTSLAKDKSQAEQTGYSTSAFGAGWVPLPLKKTDKKQPKAAENTVQAAEEAPLQSPLKDPNQLLQPAEGFIVAVEKRLMLVPKPQEALTERLNHIQMVLYGTEQFDDAGQLLSALSESFPQAAVEARQQLMQDMASFKPDEDGRLSKPTKRIRQKTENLAPTHPQATPKQVATSSPQSTSGVPLQPLYSGSGNLQNGWDSPFDESWDNDFDKNWDDYKDANKEAREANEEKLKRWEKSQKKEARFESLKSLGRGLASLAMVAVPMAGQYYLNKSADTVNNSRYQTTYPNYGYGQYQPGYGGYYYPANGYPNPYNNAYTGAYGYGVNPNQYSPYGSLATPYNYSPSAQYYQTPATSMSRLGQLQQYQQNLGW